MLSLYRKYRPRSLSAVIGQEEIKKTLSNALENETLSHAYLFVGPRGTGKTSVAKILAASLNCMNNKAKDGPCGTCESCLGIIEGTSPDVLELDAASHRGIDDIRTIRSKTNWKTIGGKYHVFIIDEVHMLTTEASNALLKTLEEPPTGVIFILCTTEANKVLDTIRSRCQTFFFKQPSPSQIEEIVENISKKEKIKIDDNSKDLIVSHARGSYRDALTILEQLAVMLDNNISYDFAAPALGDVRQDIIWKIMNELMQNNLTATIKLFEEYKNEGVDLVSLLDGLYMAISEIIMLKANNEAKVSSGANNIINLVTPSQIGQVVSGIEEAKKEIKLGFDPATVFLFFIYKTIISTDINNNEEVITEKNFLRRLEILENKSYNFSPNLITEEEVKNNKSNEEDMIRNLSLNEIIANWMVLLHELRELNPPTYAVLRNVKPEVLDDQKIILYTMHPDLLKRYASQIEKFLLKHTNLDLKIISKPYASLPSQENTEKTKKVTQEETSEEILVNELGASKD